MQPNQKQEHSELNYLSKSNHVVNDYHFVFIVDECGIIPVYDILKTKLSCHSNNCLTLIYSIPKNTQSPLFAMELANFEKRYSTQFLGYHVYTEDTMEANESELGNQIIEVVINSNTRSFLQFLVFGREYFVEEICSQLQFLGIKPSQINLQIINTK